MSDNANVSDELEEKAGKFMRMMASDVPPMKVTNRKLRKMKSSGELLDESAFMALDEDAKQNFEPVDVLDEDTGKGYGMHYRRRSPLEVMMNRKADSNMADDMFDTAEEASSKAIELGCKGSHMAGDKFMPCATHAEWMKIREAEPTPAPAAMPAPVGAPAGTQAMSAAHDDVSEKSFLCGFQRKSVNNPCEFCKGGCAPSDGVLGLADIENEVKSLYAGSEVLSSGYSFDDDIFVVDIKRVDGSLIEVFMSGDGDELGWLRISDDEGLSTKGMEVIDIISKGDAEQAAQLALKSIDDSAEGSVMAVMVDVFADKDVYVVEIETDTKSYDFYVSIEGKVLAFDEYDIDDVNDLSIDMETAMNEEDEIKALQAELDIKRLYSRERRMAMAEAGEAMPDGSFPIADRADLMNAIQASGRAKDVEAAKEHIMKRAQELDLEDMLPEEWKMKGSGKSAESDDELIAALREFQALIDSKE